MLLEIKNISKSYGAQRVLCAINQSFGEGRIVGLLGPNGAGKSTLMKIITGYIAADEGEVMIDGKRVAVDNVETKRLVGYLPEHNPLYLDMYVREYLSFVAEIYNNAQCTTKGLEPWRKMLIVKWCVELIVNCALCIMHYRNGWIETVGKRDCDLWLEQYCR